MRSIRTLIATSMVAALAVGALAAPAAAFTPGRLTVVNGIPGVKVDVCLGPNEIRSGLKYGRAYRKQLTGLKVLRFRKAGPGKCKGKVVGGRTMNFAQGSDKTVVVTSKAPRTLVFNNLGLGTAVADPSGAIAMRHAADLAFNSVYFSWTVWTDPIIKDGLVEPSAVMPYTKGSQHRGPLFVTEEDIVTRVKVTRGDISNVLARSPILDLLPNKRYEFIFVGTRASNARLVPIVTTLSAPPAP